MHPSTLGKKRLLIHKYFNVQSGKIEWFRVDKVIPNKRGRKVGYRKKKALQETIPLSERAEDAALNSQSA